MAVKASLLLPPLSVTEEPSSLQAFLIPVHHDPCTTRQYTKPEALESFPVTNTAFSVPKLPHFLFFTHQPLQPEVALKSPSILWRE